LCGANGDSGLTYANASSSFKAAGAVKLIGDVVLERGWQERPDLPLEPVNTHERALLQQVEEKPLGQA
jgi:hypothetical protein